MSEHHQPASTPNPGPSAAPETTRPPGGNQPGTYPTPDDETLTTMQRDFPGHRIWREITPRRIVYVARACHPGARPHTVVTPDLPELLAALTGSSPPGSATSHPEPGQATIEPAAPRKGTR
jgi:hypothetical protein